MDSTASERKNGRKIHIQRGSRFPMSESTMKAWRLDGMGGRLAFETVPKPVPRAGSVRVRIEASVLMSYLKPYVEGKLPSYRPPPAPFTPGTNGIGVIDAVGADIWHLKPGQRVVLSSHFVAREQIDDPAQILIGLTGSEGAAPMLHDWPDGTLGEYALAPAEVVTPLDGLEDINAAQLAAITRFVVPFGGLLRARLTAGETIVVTGATGAYGSAAVLVAIAMGAARVVAAGRNQASLDALARVAGPRVSTVALSGDVQRDAEALRAAAGGGVPVAFDMVGQANDPNATLAALHSLRRGGRLVLMGSMATDLPIPYTTVMLNSLEILGQFMYPANAYQRLLALVRSGLLDIHALTPREFALAALDQAMHAASDAGNLEYVVVRP